MRDCSTASLVWRTLVPPLIQPTFFALKLDSWLFDNLENSNISTDGEKH